MLKEKPVSFFGFIASIIGLIAISGWISGFLILASISSDFVPMAPDAAIMFIIFGLILFFELYNLKSGYRKDLIIGLAGFLSVYGLLKLIEYFIGVDLTFGDYFYPVTEKLGNFPIRQISPIAALLFFISGIAVLLKMLGGEKNKLLNIVSFLGILIVSGGFSGILGYLYGTPLLYGGNIRPAAATATIAFIFLGCGVIALAGTKTYFLQPFLGSSASGRLLRVILPLFIIIILFDNLLDNRIADVYFLNNAIFSSATVLVTIIFTSMAIIYLSNNIFRKAEEAEKERRKAEEALRQSEEQYRTLFEKAGDGIFILNSKGEIKAVNESFVQTHGYSIEEILAMNLHDLDTPDSAKFLPERIKKILSGETLRYEVEHYHKYGHLIFMEVSSCKIKIDDENYIVSFNRDITERKKAQEEINLLNEEIKKRALELQIKNNELEAINKDLESFSYTVSHDLKNPLNIIKSLCNILLREYSDKLNDKEKDHIKDISTTALRMNKIITDILKLSKITKSEIHLKELDMSTLAKSIASDLQKIQPERNVEIIISSGITAKADEGLIGEVLDNLINNAWKYTRNKDKTIIEFGVKQIEGKTTYFVKDNGAGFDMKYYDKLFAPFKRLHNESEFEGYGVGLATVQRIINRHCGKIWAEGKVGEGATFYFCLE